MSKPKRNRRRSTPRPQVKELPLTGVGVELCKDKDLLELAGRFVDESDNKKEAVTELKKIEAYILNRMAILGLDIFRAGENIWTLDVKKHIKKSKVKEPPKTEDNQAPAEPGENEP